VAVDGKRIHRIPDFTDALEQIGVGGRLRLTLKRDDKEYSVELPVIDAVGRRAPSASATDNSSKSPP